MGVSFLGHSCSVHEKKVYIPVPPNPNPYNFVIKTIEKCGGYLIALVFYGSLGGVSRLAKICTVMMPPFLIIYVCMCLWIMADQWTLLITLLPSIFTSAFTGHAAVGGFAGSTFIMAAQYGTARAVYSGDIGIGYDSIIQSETRIQDASQQARLAILSLLNNTLICTLSCLVVLVSGLWCAEEPSWSKRYLGRGS